MNVALRERSGHAASDSDTQAAFHKRLARHHRGRLALRTPDADWRREAENDALWRRQELAFLEAARAAVAAEAAAVPTEVASFMDWFQNLRETGPGQQDALFAWLASEATRAQMVWFLRQEAAGEAGFDDLRAYTQVQLPLRAKLELARNYWDEMGRGHARGAHAQLLGILLMEIGGVPPIEGTMWESLAQANTLLGLARHRRYAYASLGALGVIELTAPARVSRVADGMNRLGFDAQQRAYFDLHSRMDLQHSREWNREVIAPLVATDPACARYIAEGALMRLSSGARCFARYRQQLWAGQA